MDVRVFADPADAGYSRHQDRMSSLTPMWVSWISGFCVHDAEQNSQFPSDGTPDPPPTLNVESSWITQDCSALVMLVNPVPCP